MYARFLREKGYRVEVAANGEEAIRKASVLSPDLVLMDVSMPGISGIDATRRLKRDDKTKDIPVILLTAYVLQDPQLDAMADLGSLGCLSKLDSPNHLLRAITRGIIARKSQNQTSGRFSRSAARRRKAPN